MSKSISGGVEIINTLSTKNDGDYPLVMAESVGMKDGANAEDVIKNKLNTNQGTENNGKFMKVGADGNLKPEIVPIPDVSAQINTHDKSPTSHNDIRDSVNTLKNDKLDKNQGVNNTGKIITVGDDGNVVTRFPNNVTYNPDTKNLEYGSNDSLPLIDGVKLDTSLTKGGFAADAKITGDKINKIESEATALKEDLKQLKDDAFTPHNVSITKYHEDWILHKNNGAFTANGFCVSNTVNLTVFENAKFLQTSFDCAKPIDIASAVVLQFLKKDSYDSVDLVMCVENVKADSLMEIPIEAKYVRFAYYSTTENPQVNILTESQINTDKIKDSAITFNKQSFIEERKSNNLYDENTMIEAKKSWYWKKDGKVIIQDNMNDYARVLIPIDDSQDKISIAINDFVGDGAIYSYFLTPSDKETILKDGGAVSYNFSNVSPLEILMVKGAKYLMLSIRYYTNVIKKAKIMANYGDILPFEAYSKSYYLNNEPIGGDAIRETMRINASDNDTELFVKMKKAFDKGNVDVVFEKSTYTLKDCYDYMRDIIGWNVWRGLPIGKGCRYYFNDSTIISNPPSDNFSSSRNVLDTRQVGSDCEVNDVTLINNGGSYCIHDEEEGSLFPYCHKYNNVKMIYNKTELTESENGPKPFGCGIGFDATMIFDGCEFINADGQNSVPLAIHAPSQNQNNKPAKMNLKIKNCYFNKYSFSTNLFNKKRDDVYIYLFGNLWGSDFSEDIGTLIKNNNSIIN